MNVAVIAPINISKRQLIFRDAYRSRRNRACFEQIVYLPLSCDYVRPAETCVPADMIAQTVDRPS